MRVKDRTAIFLDEATGISWKVFTWRRYRLGRSGDNAPVVCQFGDCNEASWYVVQSANHRVRVCQEHQKEIESAGYRIVGET